MSRSEGPDENPFRPGSNAPVDVLVGIERLGGSPMSGKHMLELGLSKFLTEVDPTSRHIRSDVEMLCEHLSLPSIVSAEALSIAYALPSLHGAAIRERAILCVYLAGKRHGCIRADISSISSFLSTIDQRWTRGRILRVIALLQAKMGDDFASRMGPVAPTSVEAYIEFIFKSLSSSLPRTQAGLHIAYGNAVKIVQEIRQKHPDRLSGRSPRAQAAYIAYLAVREVEWDRLRISQRDIVWAKEIMRCSDVSKKSVTGQRYQP